ncbi:uncharacterized protein [Montipora capricornis]|uniref:uncharacterized protein n=1 Tax=Montipora capricornis TaxID=246305 RepID=UPI0035F13DE7
MGPFSARSKRSSYTGSDVFGGSEDDSVMADKGAKNYCAAGGPNKVNCSNKTGTPGISMHYFPKEESLRQKWTRFVRINRKDFVPKKSSCLCSAHFDDSCFEHKPVTLKDATGEAIELKKRLIKGSVPTRTDVVPYTSPLTDRKRRRIYREVMHDPPCKKLKLSATSTCSTTDTLSESTYATNLSPNTSLDTMLTASPSPATCTSSATPGPVSQVNDEATPCPTPNDPVSHTPPQPAKCERCEKYSKKTRSLSKKHSRLKKKYGKLENKLKELQTESETEEEMVGEEFAVEMEEELGEELKEELKEDLGEDVQDEVEDTDWGPHEDSAPSTDDYSSQSEEERDGIDSSNTVRVEPGTPCDKEPKFIVFFTKLLCLFSLFCFKCKRDQPKVTMKQRGTMVIVNQHCSICGDNSYSWKSQPMLFNGRYPAGNVLLSFSILMAGASITKILLVFKHMGLSAYNARTFFFHQKNFMFPAVLNYWERYQAALIGKIKNMKDAVWSGDGRFDSMGHSAKFGVYTMFCNTILKVVHFELLQRGGYATKTPSFDIKQGGHILASLHFNENLLRETKKTENGKDYYKVTYPKFKLGEEVVREIAVPPTYDYVAEIWKDLLAMSKEKRKTVAEKYNAKVPQPLNSQFPDRVKKSEAVVRYEERKEKEVTKLYPPAEEQDALQASSNTAQPTRKRKRQERKCRKCGKPVKDHDDQACNSNQ